MNFQKLAFAVVLVALSFAGTRALAEEAEKKAEGGEEGGEKKEKGKEKKEVKDDKPWVAVQSKISESKSKRRGAEEELTEIFKKKKTVSPESNEMRALVKEADEKYKKYLEYKEEEEKQTRILQFRFPERAAASNIGSGEKKETPSLKKMEAEKTVESQLLENYKLMKEQYPGAL